MMFRAHLLRNAGLDELNPTVMNSQTVCAIVHSFKKQTLYFHATIKIQSYSVDSVHPKGSF